LSRICRGTTLRKLERNFDDHVFLAADSFAPANFGQDLACVDAKFFRRAFSMPKEARIYSAVAERQCSAIDHRRLLHDRWHQFLGDIHELEDVEAGIFAEAI